MPSHPKPMHPGVQVAKKQARTDECLKTWCWNQRLPNFTSRRGGARPGVHPQKSAAGRAASRARGPRAQGGPEPQGTPGNHREPQSPKFL